MKKKILSTLLATAMLFNFLPTGFNAMAAPNDIIKFGDDHLREVLVAKGVDKNGDEKISKGEIGEVKELSISGYGINSLSGLEYATSLGSLNISNNTIANLSPIANLTSLATLDIGYTKVTSLAYLSKLANLKALTLDGLRNIDLNQIKGIKGLMVLSINDGAYKNYSAIESFAQLSMISFSGNKLTNINFLAKNKNLTTIVGDDNKISSLSPLKAMTSLNAVSFNNNYIKDLSAIKGQSLMLASFDGNKGIKLSTFKGGEALLLSLNNCGITSLSSLKGLRISILALSKNSISSLKGIEYISGLMGIDFSYNKVRDISPLIKASSLKAITLDHNYINRSSSSTNKTLIKFGEDTLEGIYNQYPDIALKTSKGKALSNNVITKESVKVDPINGVKISVKKNGKTVKIPKNRVFTSSGKYIVTGTVKCGYHTHKVTRSFTIDKSKPTVSVKTLKGKSVKNNATVKGGVKLTIKDSYLSSKSIAKNGKKVKWTTTLKGKGTYVITAKDKAGNITKFTVKIK